MCLDLHEVTLAKPSRLALCERLEGRLVMPKKSKMVKASDEVAIRWKTRVLVAYETCETNDENGANVFSLEIQGTDTLATRVQSNLSFVRSCILTQSRNLLVMLHLHDSSSTFWVHQCTESSLLQELDALCESLSGRTRGSLSKKVI